MYTQMTERHNWQFLNFGKKKWDRTYNVVLKFLGPIFEPVEWMKLEVGFSSNCANIKQQVSVSNRINVKCFVLVTLNIQGFKQLTPLAQKQETVKWHLFSRLSTEQVVQQF